MVVPERYDIKAGRIGRIQGDKNDANPAKAETTTVVSITIVCYVTPLLLVLRWQYIRYSSSLAKFVLILFSKLNPDLIEKAENLSSVCI